MERALTDRQKEVLECLRRFVSERGYPPTLRELCARLGIGAPKNAAKHLNSLERKGFIRRPSGLSRAIEIIGGAAAAVEVPIAGRVRAGSPHLAVEDIAGRVSLDPAFFRCAGTFLLKIEGESMIGAGIDPGDYVLVRPQEDAENGEIVVAMLGGEATVKRFFRNDGKIILRPENPWMEQMVLDESFEGLSIVGKVISIIKKLESA